MCVRALSNNALVCHVYNNRSEIHTTHAATARKKVPAHVNNIHVNLLSIQALALRLVNYCGVMFMILSSRHKFIAFFDEWHSSARENERFWQRLQTLYEFKASHYRITEEYHAIDC